MIAFKRNAGNTEKNILFYLNYIKQSRDACVSDYHGGVGQGCRANTLAISEKHHLS